MCRHGAELADRPLRGRAVTSSLNRRAGTEAIRLGTPRVERKDANVLVLDYCDVRVGERLERGVPTPVADTLAWQWNGWPHNPWRAGVQYRKEIMEAHFDPNSECEATYRFIVRSGTEEAVQRGLGLAVERPWLYRVTLNGQELPFVDAPQWFDVDMRRIGLAGLVRTGENTVRLHTRPFRPLCQVMPAYLVGEFQLIPAEQGFEIAAVAPLGLGDARSQGLPFYGGKLVYRYPFACGADAGGLLVTMGRWSGAAVEVDLDGKSAGLIVHPPYQLRIRGPLARGDHFLALTVCGSPRNMMGPFHSDGLPIQGSWVDSPSRQPPGRAYHGVAFGLEEPPRLDLCTAVDEELVRSSR